MIYLIDLLIDMKRGMMEVCSVISFDVPNALSIFPQIVSPPSDCCDL